MNQHHSCICPAQSTLSVEHTGCCQQRSQQTRWHPNRTSHDGQTQSPQCKVWVAPGATLTPAVHADSTNQTPTVHSPAVGGSQWPPPSPTAPSRLIPASCPALPHPPILQTVHPAQKTTAPPAPPVQTNTQHHRQGHCGVAQQRTSNTGAVKAGRPPKHRACCSHPCRRQLSPTAHRGTATSRGSAEVTTATPFLSCCLCMTPQNKIGGAKDQPCG